MKERPLHNKRRRFKLPNDWDQQRILTSQSPTIAGGVAISSGPSLTFVEALRSFVVTEGVALKTMGSKIEKIKDF